MGSPVRSIKRRNRPKIVARPPKTHRVDVGFTHNGTVAADFLQSIIRLYLFDAVNGIGRFQRLLDARGPYIAAQRNQLARAFVEKQEADWLLMLDNDMIFSGDTMEKLFHVAHPTERPIVAGIYMTHMNDGDGIRILPTWMMKVEDRDMIPLLEVPEGDNLLPIQGCGMGLTIIHRSVMEAIFEASKDGKWSDGHADDWPWFGHDLRTFDEEIGPVRCGEDISFCWRAQDLGFNITGATAIRASHIKTQILTEQDVLPALRIIAQDT